MNEGGGLFSSRNRELWVSQNNQDQLPPSFVKVGGQVFHFGSKRDSSCKHFLEFFFAKAYLRCVVEGVQERGARTSSFSLELPQRKSFSPSSSLLQLLSVSYSFFRSLFKMKRALDEALFSSNSFEKSGRECNQTRFIFRFLLLSIKFPCEFKVPREQFQCDLQCYNIIKLTVPSLIMPPLQFNFGVNQFNYSLRRNESSLKHNFSQSLLL